jgi:hypothetical protein
VFSLVDAALPNLFVVEIEGLESALARPPRPLPQIRSRPIDRQQPNSHFSWCLLSIQMQCQVL